MGKDYEHSSRRTGRAIEPVFHGKVRMGGVSARPGDPPKKLSLFVSVVCFVVPSLQLRCLWPFTTRNSLISIT
jgi:hypothetical protein